ADDHVMLLQGVKKLLEDGGCRVVGEAADGRTSIDLCERLKPDIAVLDLAMPGLNGIDASRAIAKVSPRTKTILLTMHKENPYVINALDAGIRGYVLKTQAAEDLLGAIHEVSANRIYLSPGVCHAVVDAYREGGPADRDPLTLREREVLQLIAEGQKTKQIAVKLGISVKTAESHRTRMM